MQIDSDADDETHHRGDGEKTDRAKDNNQVSVFHIYDIDLFYDLNICIILRFNIFRCKIWRKILVMRMMCLHQVTLTNLENLNHEKACNRLHCHLRQETW
jgi:hypothetical protein